MQAHLHIVCTTRHMSARAPKFILQLHKRGAPKRTHFSARVWALLLLLSGKTQKRERTQAPNAITKRYHPTRSQNANSNGGDASRVGKILRLLHTTFCHARATRQNGYTTRTSQLRGSGFAIRATEFPLPHYPHNIPYKHIYTTLLTLQTNADKRADRISLCLHFLTI